MRPGANPWGNYDKLHFVIGMTPQRLDVARQFFYSAAEGFGWRTLEPIVETPGQPRATLYGMAFAREYGDNALLSTAEQN